jgi:hypothetical protein
MQLFQMPNHLGNRAQCRMDISVPAVRNPEGLCGLDRPEKYPDGVEANERGDPDSQCEVGARGCKLAGNRCKIPLW